MHDEVHLSQIVVYEVIKKFALLLTVNRIFFVYILPVFIWF